MKFYLIIFNIGLLAISGTQFVFADNYQITRQLLETETQFSQENLYKTYLNEGLKYFEQENFEDAKLYFWKALNIDPQQPDPYVNLGIVHIYQKDYETALRLLLEAEKLAQDNYSKKEVLYYNLGIAYFKTNDFEKAKEYFLKAVDVYSDFGEALYYLGFCYDIENKGQDALLNMVKAKTAFAKENKTQFYQKTSEAIEALKIKYNQDSATLSKKIEEEAKSLYSQNKLDQAVRLLEESIFLDFQNKDAYYILGNIYFEKGAIYLALENFKKAANLDPNYSDANLSISEIYVKLKKYDDALAIINKTLNQDKNNARAYYDLGLIYSQLGKPKEAEKYFSKAKEISKETPIKSLIEINIPTLSEKSIQKIADVKIEKIQEIKTKSFYATSQSQKNKGVFVKGYYIAEKKPSSLGKRINKFQKTLDY